MTLEAGLRLGSYEILSPLGAGGMGEVYRARDPRLERDVAIKVLPAALATDETRLRRFQQEARAAAALSHPNILAVHDLGTHDEAPYIVTELLPGQTLRQALSRGPLPVRTALDYGIQIATGLAAAHERGIVHRDLKPGNLFVTPDGRVKILDFGLAKLIGPAEDASERATEPTETQNTTPGTLLGTVGYMAPEQVNGRPADNRSDIFSFGCVLYEMLTGRRAFKRDTAAETMAAILKEEPPEVGQGSPGVSPSLERVLRHCLEKQPARRFQSARDLVFDLEAEAGASGSAVRATPPAWPRRRWLGAATLALLALATAFVGGRMSGGPARVPTPSIRQLTFGIGTVRAARFAPDGQTIVFGAAWNGAPIRLFMIRLDNDEPTAIQAPDASLLAISKSGEMAVSVGHAFGLLYIGQGTLAQMPLLGGAPRALLEGVSYADWTPDGTGLLVVRHVWAKDTLEFPIGKVLHESGAWISYPRFSPAGDRIAFVDHRIFGNLGGSLVVADLGGRQTRLSLSGSRRGLAWSPDGHEIWFTGWGREGNAVRAIDMSGRERVLLPLPGDAILLDVSREGRVLLATEQVRREVHVLAPGMERPRNLAILNVPVARHVSADGSNVLMTVNTSRGANVFLQRSDGSAPPVRLGEGEAAGLSPDGSWAIAIRQGTPSQVVLLPTGPGEPRTLPTEPLTVDAAKWLPNGTRLLLAGREAGRGARFFLIDAAGGPLRPFGPEGIKVAPHALPVSADGSLVAATSPSGANTLYPVDGGAHREVEGLGADRVILGFTPDGRGLFVTQRLWPQTSIDHFDLATRRLEPWKELSVADPSGIVAGHVNLSADGRSYAWTVSRVLGNLFVVEGLR